MVATCRVFQAIFSLALCSITASMAIEIGINSSDGMIPMDSFLAHEMFYSSLQELIKNKVQSAVEDILAHSKVDATQLLPNIDATEYTMLQILQSLARNDLPFASQLAESSQYRLGDEYPGLYQGGAVSDFLKSNIAYSPSEMYKVVKYVLVLERDGLKSIPKSTVEGILSIMNKSEIFKEASNRADVDVMKWVLLSENNLDLSTAVSTACRQNRSDIIRMLIENDVSNRMKTINVTNCNNENILHYSIQTRSLRFLSLLIRDGISLNVPDERGYPPLYLAVKNNFRSGAELLIREGADVNQETNEGNIALHEAARKGMFGIAKLLIDEGSYVAHKNKYGISPLMMSEKYVITNIARYLINNKMNISEDDLVCSLYFIKPDREEEEGSSQGEQDVNTSIILQNSELVKRMKSRVVWDFCKGEGIRARFLNITMKNLISPLVQSMINIGIRIDVESEATKDAFLNSIERYNEEMATLLLDKGVSVNTTWDGRSALHVAAINGRTGIFHQLLERGANILAVRSNGRTILHSACEGQQKEMVEYLLWRGLDVNSTDSNSITPLQLAASTGNYGVIASLVKHGANVRFRSSNTPLLAATLSGNVKAVNFLLDHGADIEEKANYNMSPLIAAVNAGYEDVVEALLNRGASLTATEDDRGDTAFHIAVERGSLKIVKMLLEGGHNIDVTNNEGKTPLGMALRLDRYSIVSCLFHYSFTETKI